MILRRTDFLFNVKNFIRLYSAHLSGNKTCLFDLHLKYGAKMVDFAGFSMPLNYDLSIADSVRHTRTHVSIFDCSHMLQTEIGGQDREVFIESLTTADINGLAENSSTLSIFTNERGGILDDLILSKTDSEIIYMVTNASRIENDLKLLEENLKKWKTRGKDVSLKVLNGRALIAVQGPETAKLLQPETNVSLESLYFMKTAVGNVCGVENCRVTRCGYTGEDGVEISIEPDKAAIVVERLLASKNASAALAGLGARDAARIEAGLCLYGNDINEDTTPVEAGLSFVIAKRRRQNLGFPGAERIVEQLEKKTFAKKRVGLISDGGRSPRGHIPINDPKNNAVVGFVTSGCPSPSLNKNIAMGYIDKDDAAIGTVLEVDFGKKKEKVTVTKMPFVKTNYYIPKKKT